ncbi:MAG TPA: AAA family ATPase, partial [Candidatus Baltobacteraceae bacterium]|nr:AAA family ATPase [Candidatus Baltobacteraceae bacterium]
IAVQEEDDGLSRRILGMLLTWMSEKRRPVFMVATANDIMRLPPEIVRKGRFDEIFFVDLPSAENRGDIWKIHLTKRNLDPNELDLENLVKETEGFSGSEIEQAIVSAMYAAHAQGIQVTEDELLNEIKQTKPLSVIMAEKIEEVRDWAAKRTVPCD